MKQTKTIFLISKIREKANKFILADLAQHGITKLAPSHGDILACLYQRERVTMKEISDSIHRTKPTVTVLVNKLAELGLVKKFQAAEDSRVIYVELTEQGKALLRQRRRAGWMRSAQNGKPMKQKNILPNWKRILCRSTI